MNTGTNKEEILKDWKPESENADVCPICSSKNIAEGSEVVDGGIANGLYLLCRDCGTKGSIALC